MPPPCKWLAAWRRWGSMCWMRQMGNSSLDVLRRYAMIQLGQISQSAHLQSVPFAHTAVVPVAAHGGRSGGDLSTGADTGVSLSNDRSPTIPGGDSRQPITEERSDHVQTQLRRTGPARGVRSGGLRMLWPCEERDRGISPGSRLYEPCEALMEAPYEHRGLRGRIPALYYCAGAKGFVFRVWACAFS